MSVMIFFSCLSNFPLSLSNSLERTGRVREEREGEGWRRRGGRGEEKRGKVITPIEFSYNYSN